MAHRRFYFLQHSLTALEETRVTLLENRGFLRDRGRHIDQEQYLAAAEACRMGRRLDHFLLPAVLRAIGKGPAEERHLIAIGADSVRDPFFPSWLAGQLEEKRIKGDRLVLRLPVTAVQDHRSAAERLCRAVRALGCRYALSPVGDDERQWRLCRELGAALCILSPELVASLEAGGAARCLPGSLTGSVLGGGTAIVAEGALDTGRLPRLWRAGVRFLGPGAAQQAFRVSLPA